MEGKKNLLSYDGYKKLEDELHYLKVKGRKEAAQKIKEAREQGDLSENAEYTAAREAQAEMESRIVEIENILRDAVIADENTENSEVIRFGCTVTFEDMDTKKTYQYRLVGSSEADLMNGKLSYESPLGQRLNGAKVGQIITLDTPKGTKNYKITDLSYKTSDSANS